MGDHQKKYNSAASYHIRRGILKVLQPVKNSLE